MFFCYFPYETIKFDSAEEKSVIKIIYMYMKKYANLLAYKRPGFTI